MPSICERSAPVRKRCAEIEARFVDARLMSGPSPGQRRGWSGDRRGEMGQARLNGGIAQREVLLIHVEEFEILLQDEEVFRAIVPG